MSISKAELATQVRSFIAFNRNAVLSTQSQSNSGYPFGSVTPYDVDASGNLIIWVAKIAEHYRNLLAEPKASLFMLEQGGLNDPQPYGRATVLLNFEPVAGTQIEAVATSYHARFPAKWSHEIDGSFVFLRGTPERIRWIGGFGQIAWIDGDSYRSQARDNVAYFGRDICDHMNQDHRAAIVELLVDSDSTATPPPSIDAVDMIEVDSGGFVAAIEASGSRQFRRVNFPERLADSEQVRKTLISMLAKARSKK
jgi:putative heme iron utilization protein